MSGKNYRDLHAWQRAMDMIAEVHAATEGFPRREIYGLTSQARRAVVSIASNIAEGQGRRSTGEFLNCLSIAHGSLREAETQILVAERLGYLASEVVERLMGRASEVGRLINGLMNALSRKS